MTGIPDFEGIAMVDGARYADLMGDLRTVHVRQVGDITFPSGQVLVSDAFVADFESDPALERTVPAGPHAVFVSEASFGELTDIITAWVRFSDHKIKTWTPAFYEGYEPDDTYLPGFGVDSGTACIADRGSAASVNHHGAVERAAAALHSEHHPSPRAIIHPDCENFFLCHSGIGDGFYTPYWGLDDSGEPVILMVDFNCLMVPLLDVKTVTTPLPRGQVVAHFERPNVSVRTTWLPLWGPRKLVVRGGFASVRALHSDGSERLVPTSNVLTTTYVVDVPDGTTLEIGATKGYVPARPLSSG